MVRTTLKAFRKPQHRGSAALRGSPDTALDDMVKYGKKVSPWTELSLARLWKQSQQPRPIPSLGSQLWPAVPFRVDSAMSDQG